MIAEIRQKTDHELDALKARLDVPGKRSPENCFMLKQVNLVRKWRRKNPQAIVSGQ